MIYVLRGDHWYSEAQGWIILRLDEENFLYPNGKIVKLLRRHQPFLKEIP
jgi:hypothetical protein